MALPRGVVLVHKVKIGATRIVFWLDTKTGDGKEHARCYRIKRMQGFFQDAFEVFGMISNKPAVCQWLTTI